MGRLGLVVLFPIRNVEAELKTERHKGGCFSLLMWMVWLYEELQTPDVVARERLEELRPLYEKAREKEVNAWLGELRTLRDLLEFREGENGVSFKEWCESDAALLPCSIPQLVLTTWNDDKAQKLAEEYAVGLMRERDDDGIQKIVKTPKAKEWAEYFLVAYMFELFLAYHYLRGTPPVYEENGKVEAFEPTDPLGCIIETAENRGMLLGVLDKVDKAARPSLAKSPAKMQIVAEAILENPKATATEIMTQISLKSVAVTPNHKSISATQQRKWLEAFQDLPEEIQQSHFDKVKQNRTKQK